MTTRTKRIITRLHRYIDGCDSCRRDLGSGFAGIRPPSSSIRIEFIGFTQSKRYLLRKSVRGTRREQS